MVFRLVCAALCALFTGFQGLQAAEGMWLPHYSPALGATAEKLGIQQAASDWRKSMSIVRGSVVSLGHCTGSFVSDTGLIITNHHCVLGSLQKHSTVDRDLMAAGFAAKSMADELPAAAGTRVSITLSSRDVTDQVFTGLDVITSDYNRKVLLEYRKNQLVTACEDAPGVSCRIAAHHEGTRLRLIRERTLGDVRLVYAPPESIGKFGGQLDNWQWPRHTGDFAFLRAYVAPSGEGSGYAPGNIPFKPKNHLALTTSGLAPGEAAIAAGFPGQTTRHRLDSEVEYQFEVKYPRIHDMLRDQAELLRQQIGRRPELKMIYARLLTSLDNYVKYLDGVMAGYEATDLLQQKKRDAEGFTAWLVAQGRGESLRTDQEYRESLHTEHRQQNQELTIYLSQRSTLLKSAMKIYKWSIAQDQSDSQREVGFRQGDLGALQKHLGGEKSFDAEVDALLWQQGLGAVEQADRAAGLLTPTLEKLHQMPPAQRLDRIRQMYRVTELASGQGRLAWLDKSPAEIRASHDPFLRLAVEILPQQQHRQRLDHTSSGRMNRLLVKWMKDYLEYRGAQGDHLYADANRTLRVTMGKVVGLEREELAKASEVGGIENYFTTIHSLAAKHTGQAPFNAPVPLLTAARTGSFPGYELGNGKTLPVNFMMDLDISSGSSGSPTLNRHGQIVGLVFDSHQSGVISDWHFVPAKARSIHVDSRYIIWVLKEIFPASRIIEELKLDTPVTH